MQELYELFLSFVLQMSMISAHSSPYNCIKYAPLMLKAKIRILKMIQFQEWCGLNRRTHLIVMSRERKSLFTNVSMDECSLEIVFHRDGDCFAYFQFTTCRRL